MQQRSRPDHPMVTLSLTVRHRQRIRGPDARSLIDVSPPRRRANIGSECQDEIQGLPINVSKHVPGSSILTPTSTGV